MKILQLSLFSFVLFSAVRAQKCPDINITGLMGGLQLPGAASTSFGKCKTEKNDHHQTVITNYGSDLIERDTLVARLERDFNIASVTNLAGYNQQMPNQQDINAAKDLSEQLKNMTPEQQKEWAMKMANQKAANAKPPQDDPATLKLVMQTQDIATHQLKMLDDEFSAKWRDLIEGASRDISAVPQVDRSKCPTDKTGLAYCGCVNELAAAYWKKVLAIRESYDNQKVALLSSYLTRMKGLAATVDNNVGTLKNGDAIKSADFKRILLSAQASTFAQTFGTAGECIKNIRKEGSDIYLNKFNADAGVYDISCATK